MLFRRKPKEGTVGDGQAPAAQDAPKAGDKHQAVLRDELGLFHLWYLELRLHDELARAARVGTVFSLATWQLGLLPGEIPGPELLRRAAELITSNLRSYDVLARIDRERFAAILFDADFDAASTVAFRIKGDLQVRVPSAGRWRAGVATFQRDGVDGDALIQAALRRLDEDARAA